MINAIYGTKIGMTQLFDEDGQVTPVTVIKADPNKVCQVKTTATDGYEAVQLGFGTIKEKKVIDEAVEKGLTEAIAAFKQTWQA